MTTDEIVVIVGGALLGYWIVTSLLSTKHDAKGTDGHPDKSDSRQQASGEETSAPAIPRFDDIKKNWHRILEVAESSDKDQITAAYKQKIGQHHPDKVATLGQELRALAEQKCKQINMAYDYALKSKD